MKKINFNNIAKILKKNKNIVFASIFGSSQDGIIKDNSDLDLAIYFYNKEDYMSHATLLSEISSMLDFDNIDFVDLNSTENIVLAFEALRGKIFYKADPEKAAEYTSLIARLYEDRKNL